MILSYSDIPKSIIRSDKLALVKTPEKDLPAIVAMEAADRQYITPYSLERHQQVIFSEDEVHLSVIRLPDQKRVGFIILAGLSSPHKALEFRRIVISEKRKGYGRESLRLVKKYCFEQLRFHRLWLDVFEDNHRAIQLYRSENFRKEGTLRECAWHSNRYLSLCIFSMLESEYTPA